MKGLESIASHHLEAQRQRAAAILAAARQDAGAMLAKAEADAAAIVSDARREGESSADLDTNRDWIAGRRRARGMALAARNDAYAELRRRCMEAIRGDSRFHDLVADVADGARRTLGPGADVTIDADTVVAARRGRHARWSLEDVLDEVLGTLPHDVEGLWT